MAVYHMRACNIRCAFIFIILSFVTVFAYAGVTVSTDETTEISDNEVLQLDADLTINLGGTLIGASGSQIRVSGNWNNSGTYTHGDGAVYFTGSATSQINGNNTFHTLVVDLAEQDTSAGKALQFVSGTIQTITSKLQLKGDADDEPRILSTSSADANINLNNNDVEVDISDIYIEKTVVISHSDSGSIPAPMWLGAY